MTRIWEETVFKTNICTWAFFLNEADWLLILEYLPHFCHYSLKNLNSNWNSVKLQSCKTLRLYWWSLVTTWPPLSLLSECFWSAYLDPGRAISISLLYLSHIFMAYSTSSQPFVHLRNPRAISSNFHHPVIHQIRGMIGLTATIHWV